MTNYSPAQKTDLNAITYRLSDIKKEIDLFLKDFPETQLPKIQEIRDFIGEALKSDQFIDFYTDNIPVLTDMQMMFLNNPTEGLIVRNNKNRNLFTFHDGQWEPVKQQPTQSI